MPDEVAIYEYQSGSEELLIPLEDLRVDFVVEEERLAVCGDLDFFFEILNDDEEWLTYDTHSDNLRL